jgi:hypothetical protein
MTAMSKLYTLTISFQSLRNKDFHKKPRRNNKSKILWRICLFSINALYGYQYMVSCPSTNIVRSYARYDVIDLRHL